MFIEIFGVNVVSTIKAPMDKVIQTAGVLAQYLDNNEGSLPDDLKILSYLSVHNYNTGLILTLILCYKIS